MNNIDWLLRALIGGGYLDWKQLDEYIDKYQIDPENIAQEIEFTFGGEHSTTFNELMYATLYLGFYNMKNYILKVIEENKWNIKDEIRDWIENVEFDCFVNYLDSFIQIPVFCDYDMEELTGDKRVVAYFIADVWKKIRRNNV